MADTIENPGGIAQVTEPVAAPPKNAPNEAKARALAKWAEIEGSEEKAPEPQGIGTSPSKETPEEKKPEESKADEPESPKIAALARREKFQREQHQRRMQELRTLEKEIDAKKAAVPVPGSDFATAFSRDPIGTLRKYGVSGKYAEAAKALWMEEIGDAAPKEYKDDVWRRSIESQLKAKDEELASIKREREAERENAEAEKVIGAYRGHISSAFDKAGDDRPHVKAFMGHDAKGLLNEVWEHVVAFGNKNPDAEMPTPEEILDYAEKMLATRAQPFRAIFAPKVEQTGQKVETAAGPPTLSDRSSAPIRPTPSTRSVEEVKSKLIGDLDRINWD